MAVIQSKQDFVTVSSASEGSSDWTSIAPLPGGGFVTVWHDGEGKDGDRSGVYGRFLNADFERVGDEFLVNTLTTGFQTKSRVAALSDGTFMVVWAGGDGSYQGQVFNVTGSKVGSQFIIGPWFNQEADIIGTQNDQFMVVRAQSNQDKSILSIYSRDGTELANDITLSSHLGMEVRLTELGTDRYLAVWYDGRNPAGSEIYARFFDNAGNLIGEEFRLNVTTANNQQAPEITHTVDGGFAAVWQSYAQDGELFDIYFRKFDAAGSAVTDELLVNQITTGQQSKPSIQVTDTGDFVVAWQSDHLGETELFYQTISNSGVKLGSNVQLSVDQTGKAIGGNEVDLVQLSNGSIAAAWDQKAAIYAKSIEINLPENNKQDFVTVSSASEGSSDWTSIAPLPGGGFVTVWHDGEGKDGDRSGVYGRFLNADFERVGDEFLVNTLTTGFQTKSRVAALSDGTFMVVWAGGDGSYQGQVFNVTGSKVGSQFIIGPWFNQEADIIGTQNDQFMVVRAQSNQDKSILSIYSRDGTELANDITLSSHLGMEVRLTELGTDRYLAVWYDGRNPAGSEIYARFFDNAGNLIGEEFRLNVTTANNQQAPEITHTVDGGFAAVWQSYAQDGELFDIYFRKFDAAGSAVTDELLVNQITTGQQSKPSIQVTDTGDFVVAWQSDHLGETELFYQTISNSGVKLGSNVQLSVDQTGKAIGGNEVDLVQLSNGSIAAAWDQKAAIYAKSIEINLPENNKEIFAGSEWNDFIIAASNNQSLLGFGGDDTLVGSNGSDIFEGGKGDDHIKTGAGDDFVTYTMGADLIELGSGKNKIEVYSETFWDSKYIAQNVSGSGQVGTLEKVGLSGKLNVDFVVNTPVDSQLQNELVLFANVDDAGSQFGYALFLHDAFSAFNDRVALSKDSFGHESSARINGITKIVGSVGDDLIDLTSPDYVLKQTAVEISTGAGDDIVWGSHLDEMIIGGEGKDILFGGAGKNILHGGAGADEFQFTVTSTSDTVTDFDPEEGDKLIFFNNNTIFDRSSVNIDEVANTLNIEHTYGNIMVGFENFNLSEITSIDEILFIY